MGKEGGRGISCFKAFVMKGCFFCNDVPLDNSTSCQRKNSWRRKQFNSFAKQLSGQEGISGIRVCPINFYPVKIVFSPCLRRRFSSHTSFWLSHCVNRDKKCNKCFNGGCCRRDSNVHSDQTSSPSNHVHLWLHKQK